MDSPLTRRGREVTFVTANMTVLIVFGFILLAAGIIGCVLPVIPGPPLSYAALILLSIAWKWEAFTPTLLIVLGLCTVVVTVLDYLLPILISKKKGAGKAGIWGSLIGMVAGIVFFPPFGVIIGTFVGAVLGELIFSNRPDSALKAGWGVFLGTMLGIVLKLGVSGVIAFFFTRAVLTG
jgi:uncharacterized protein YqgC (DUF456 family)